MSPVSPRDRGRRQLLLLAALFFVPLLVAFWLYYGADGWRPAGGTNQGELIDPAVPLPDAALARPDGTRLPPDFLHGKWTIAYVGDGRCDERHAQFAIAEEQGRQAVAGIVTQDPRGNSRRDLRGARILRK